MAITSGNRDEKRDTATGQGSLSTLIAILEGGANADAAFGRLVAGVPQIAVMAEADPTGWGSGWPVTREEKAAQLDALRDGLRALVRPSAAAEDAPANGVMIRSPLAFYTTEERGRRTLAIAGHWRAVLVFRIVQTLLRHGLDRVQVCPGCERVFVKRYRREYCGTRCQKKMQARRLRAEEKAWAN